MIPDRSDLVGRWSEDIGYMADLSRDTTLEFREDGSLVIASPRERIAGGWEMPAPGRLVLVVCGNRLGAFAVRVERRQLPLGEFAVLESDGGLLPFDRRKFTRVEA